jgi:hypothetical protein
MADSYRASRFERIARAFEESDYDDHDHQWHSVQEWHQSTPEIGEHGSVVIRLVDFLAVPVHGLVVAGEKPSQITQHFVMWSHWNKVGSHGSEGGPKDPLQSLVTTIAGFASLPPGWDDEDAIPIMASTCQRANDLLMQFAKELPATFGCALPLPKASPLSTGSIDLHWDLPEGELLINIPPDARTPCSFYGDEKGKVAAFVKGELADQRTMRLVLLWLALHSSLGGQPRYALSS